MVLTPVTVLLLALLVALVYTLGWYRGFNGGYVEGRRDAVRLSGLVEATRAVCHNACPPVPIVTMSGEVVPMDDWMMAVPVDDIKRLSVELRNLDG